jgi:hypothetical protein
LKAWINKKRTRKKNCYESLDQQEGEDNGDNGNALKAWINKEERTRKKNCYESLDQRERKDNRLMKMF